MTPMTKALMGLIHAYAEAHGADMSNVPASNEASAALKAALAQQGEQAKPVAYITDTHQGPMVWTPEMYDEACTYCDDGEFPVPLYTAAPAPAPQAQEPCPNGSKCKHGAWCTEVYCQELCEFRNQPAPQPAQGRSELPPEEWPAEFNEWYVNLPDFKPEQLWPIWNAHALQSAQPVAQYDKTEMNAFVTDLYQRKSTDGQHGFYETLFHVVHKAIARVGIREVK